MSVHKNPNAIAVVKKFCDLKGIPTIKNSGNLLVIGKWDPLSFQKSSMNLKIVAEFDLLAHSQSSPYTNLEKACTIFKEFKNEIVGNLLDLSKDDFFCPPPWNGKEYDKKSLQSIRKILKCVVQTEHELRFLIHEYFVNKKKLGTKSP